MPNFFGCNEPLVCLIQTDINDYTWIYDVIEDIDISMSNQPNNNPIPFGTSVTDHIERRPDIITITGFVNCLYCPDIFGRVNKQNVVTELKRLKERFVYEPATKHVTLTSNDWIARYMILKDVRVNERQRGTQQKQIVTTWEGANLAGTISNPFYERGGIVYL